MRTTVSITAAGPSNWVPVSYYQNPFSVSLEYAPNADASGIMAKVQSTKDDPQSSHGVTSLTRVGTTVTVVDPLHGLATNDCVMVMNTEDTNLDTARGVGTDVTVVDVNTYTYVVANTGILVPAAPHKVRVVTLRVDDHPIMTGMAARADGNYAFPCQAVRIRTTAYTSGSASLTVIQGAGR